MHPSSSKPTVIIIGRPNVGKSTLFNRLVGKRLAERGMTLRFTDAALDRLAEAGFDPVYGARPLKRAIQHQVENPLASEVLAGRFASGDVVTADAGPGPTGQLVFEVSRPH